MQVRLPSFVQNFSFNSAREVVLRNPITVAVAAVALGVFALYSLYTWWTTPKSFTFDQGPSSSLPSFLHPKSLGALAAFATISLSDRCQIANVLGLGELGYGIADFPEFKESIAQADGLSIRSKMTAPMMFGVFTEGNPYVAIAVDSAKRVPSVEEVIILFQEKKENDSSSKKVWSQLKDTSDAMPRLFPYFFDENFVADLQHSQDHPTVTSYFEMQKLSEKKAAQDRNSNYWTLAKFDS